MPAVANLTADRTTLAYRPELDGIRAIAILLVLAQHINLPSSTLAGMVGVNLFFVLSGYLITSLLLREREVTGRIDLRSFYERRIRRLIPALVAVLIATGALMAILGRFGEYLPQAAVSFFYVADIAKAIGYDLGYVGHTWSLALEEQFYLLWPALLIFLPRRFLAPVAIAGIVGAVALQFLLVPDDILAHFRPDVRADAVLWGCLIALVPAALKVPRWATAAALIGVIGLSFTPFPWPHAISVSSVLSAIFIAGAATLAPMLSVRPLVRIGQISYGMYLWHAIPVGLLNDETAAGNVLAMVAVVVITIAVALASERWVEKPFRKPRQAPVSGFASDPSPAPTPSPS
jgi:peptidoglycan/LPS O-acetylase OafA/YrhL